MSERNLEQRSNIKFCVKLGKTASETLGLLRQVYGEDAMNKTSVFEWHKRFKGGQEDVKDNHRSGHPKTGRSHENVERVRQLIKINRSSSIRAISKELNINRETVRKILIEDLELRKSSEKMVPRITCDEDNLQCEDSSDRSSQMDVFEKVDTKEETWC